MIDRELRTQHGFSLMEVIVALVILGVLTAFAIITFGRSRESLERQNVAREFKISLERARFDSVRRRASSCLEMSRVEITSPTSFDLLVDSNENGVLEPEIETRRIDFGARSKVAIVHEVTPTYPVVFRFNQRGHASRGECGAETAIDTPTVFCTTPCSFPEADGSNSNLVFLSRTGTAVVLDGGSPTPAPNSPSIANIDNTNQINPMLAIWDVPTPTVPGASPSPTATPVPTPTPALTPTPNPSVTPTPSTTPVPTATPARWCSLGEQPAINLCVCGPTQYLQSGSGRCRSL